MKARVSELRDVIDRLERPQRRGRPRKLEVIEPPQHVAGGNHEPPQTTTNCHSSPTPPARNPQHSHGDHTMISTELANLARL